MSPNKNIIESPELINKTNLISNNNNSRINTNNFDITKDRQVSKNTQSSSSYQNTSYLNYNLNQEINFKDILNKSREVKKTHVSLMHHDEDFILSAVLKFYSGNELYDNKKGRNGVGNHNENNPSNLGFNKERSDMNMDKLGILNNSEELMFFKNNNQFKDK